MDLDGAIATLVASAASGTPFPATVPEVQMLIGGCTMVELRESMDKLPSDTSTSIAKEVRRIRRNFKNTAYQKMTRQRRRDEPILMMGPSLLATTERMLLHMRMSRTQRAHTAVIGKRPLKIVFRKNKKACTKDNRNT